jgi:hypothetical protein
MRWIPDLATPQQGVIAVAAAALRQELFALARTLAQRFRLNIERLGP